MSETPLSPTSSPRKKKTSAKDSKDQKPQLPSGPILDQENASSSSPINLDRVPNYPLRDRKAESLKRLKVPLSKIRQLPPINKILKETKGGISAAIEAMRFSDGELSSTFLEKWDSLSEWDQESIEIEIVAFACGINPVHLLGEIQMAMREYSVIQVKLLAVEGHPEVMRKSIEFAQTPGGVQDRKQIHEMLGALSSPKGPMFIKNFFAGNLPDEEKEKDDDEETTAKTPAEEMVSDENFVFPDSELMQERIQPMRQKLLAGK